jgi:DNA-binding GntR family transcriptional regulator
MAVRWLVEHRSDISSLEQDLLDMRSDGDEADASGRIIDADARFHLHLVALSGLPRLLASYSAIRDIIELLLASGMLRRQPFINTQEERHRELYEMLSQAVHTGNSTELLQELEIHILAGMGLAGDLNGE